MPQFFLSAWRSGLRGRGFWGVFFLGIAFVAVAYFSASFSPRQPRTVALDIGLSGLRFSLVLFAITIVQELVGNEIERRCIVLALSYPVSRAHYLVGRYLGVAALTGCSALILGGILWIAVYSSALQYKQQFAISLGGPYWIAIFGIWLDVMVVAAFVLWIASISTVRMLPLALGAIFAIAGKALGSVVDYLARGADGQEDMVAVYGPLMEMIRYLIPDLSRLDWRVWPMYGLQPDGEAMILAAVMGVAYMVVMVGLALHAFSRREFL
ncbi:MAG TPA: ABC transporter permease subunit [Rhodocyclaceae bacterium]|nr:ABC transporter permease subunit [Rhodocyclaceae bacterium]